MKPRVVWALQAPTLLNILGRSTAWTLYYADLGDAGDLAEARLLEVPPFDGGAASVRAVFVTTTVQWDCARRAFPAARLFWVAHNGRPGLIAGDRPITDVVVLSREVARLQVDCMPPPGTADIAARKKMRFHVLVPHYEPQRIWQWRPGLSWNMLNRPATRHPAHLNNLDRIETASGVTIQRFGQDQPLGFADRERRLALLSHSSCYVAALPPWAGFGLAEHECLAAGCPIVSGPWGDLADELAGYGALASDERELADWLRLLNGPEKPPCVDELALYGLAMISERRTMRLMDDSIGELLGTL